MGRVVNATPRPLYPRERDPLHIAHYNNVLQLVQGNYDLLPGDKADRSPPPIAEVKSE